MLHEFIFLMENEFEIKSNGFKHFAVGISMNINDFDN